ncbi:MAG: PEGA domain-containing protein [Kofleriaceae bacterium]
MRWLFSCVLFAFAIPRVAGADGAGIVATSREPAARGAVAKAMREAMAGRAERILEDAVADARAAVAAGAVPVETLAGFRRVRAQIDAGWRNYQRVAVEQARDALVAARTAAEPLVALPGGTELYADAALRLGMVLSQLGRRDEANVVLALALALDGDRPITTAEFSPDLVAVVDAARATPVALHTVRIETTPPGARIRIDGKDVGVSPLDVQVTRGQHLIVARAPEHRPAVQGVTPDATRIDVQLEPDEEATRLGGPLLELPDIAAQQLVDATLRYADLDEVVLVADTIRRGGPALLAQRCSGAAPARCSAVVEIGYTDRAGLPTAAKSAWDAVLVGDLRYPPTVLGDEGGRVDDRCSWCRSPILWTGVGVVVITGVALTIYALSSSQPTPVVTVPPLQP